MGQDKEWAVETNLCVHQPPRKGRADPRRLRKAGPIAGMKCSEMKSGAKSRRAQLVTGTRNGNPRVNMTVNWGDFFVAETRPCLKACR